MTLRDAAQIERQWSPEADDVVVRHVDVGERRAVRVCRLDGAMAWRGSSPRSTRQGAIVQSKCPSVASNSARAWRSTSPVQRSTRTGPRCAAALMRDRSLAASWNDISDATRSNRRERRVECDASLDRVVAIVIVVIGPMVEDRDLDERAHRRATAALNCSQLRRPT